MRRMKVDVESWPIAGSFTISRGSRTEAHVVVATIYDGDFHGRGECVPYARYGETVDSVAAQIRGLAQQIGDGLTRHALLNALPPGAARNAVDCALWDFEAKQAGERVWQLAGVAAPKPAITAYTLSLGSTESMGQAAREARARPLLKVKLGGEGDADRIAAVRDGAPEASLIVDANEAWTPETFAENLAACRRARVVLVEQPLAAGHDHFLETVPVHERGDILFCADESLHTAADLPAIAARYQAINIKLDKTGGLTTALDLKKQAVSLGLKIMIGCMVGTSLAMAPAMVLTPGADFVDLDGPLLLKADRMPPLRFEGSVVHPPVPALWG